MTKFYKNEYLFSEIYLKELTELGEEKEVTANLSTIKDYFEYADPNSLKKWNESFIIEVLKSLGFHIDDISQNVKLLTSFDDQNNPISLCYSVLPDKSLDNTLMGINYAEKTIRYLKENNIKWGILTNGLIWRIYHTQEANPYENYLQIDLKDILRAEDTQSFQIFHHFMKAKNFVIDENDKCKFDIFKQKSKKKIEYIEEELKKALKQREEGGKGILTDLCMGYVEYLRENENSNFNDDNLRETIYGSAMLYMFRILFMFYAKARNLMTEENIKIFEKIIETAEYHYKNGLSNENKTDLWEMFRTIYSNIDLVYDGGLFNPVENEITKFIENNRISDYYLSNVIYHMTFYENELGNMQPISYRDMGVRHLGTLYEGLLEHKLFIAKEDIEVKVSKKEIKFIPQSEGGKIRKGNFIPKGKVYFASDKYKRKSLGAYYTPEYIVDYIVKNTVGEKLKGLQKEFEDKFTSQINHLKSSISQKDKDSLKKLIKKEIIEFINKKIFKLSILDPATGSGHFLVNTTNLITNRLIAMLNSLNLKIDLDTSPRKWRRRIVENCIYGVDKNELAVNLTKLTLWILSMAKDRPLSFLDHHIKKGDSLVGAKLKDVGKYPGNKKSLTQQNMFKSNKNFEKTVKEVVGNIMQIEKTETEKIADIDSKKQLLEDIEAELKPYKSVCDFHIQSFVSDDIKEHNYNDKIKNFNKNYDYNAYDNYIHWEIEFPEIMLEQNGFDCVVGNPPYIQIQKFKGDIYQKKLEAPKFYTFSKSADVYCLFYERGTQVLKNKGELAFITSNKWQRARYGKKLREYLSTNTTPNKIIDFTGYKVFESAGVDTSILKFQKGQLPKETKGCTIKDDFNNKNKLHDYFEKNKAKVEIPSKNIWIICSKDEYNIKKKIEKIGKSLKEWNLNINSGIKTGYNKAFIIDCDKKDELIKKDPKSAEIIKPILRGRDIKRYKANFADKWLITTFPAISININEYPAVKNYLKTFGKRIYQSGKSGCRKKTNHRWFETQDSIAYYKEFEKEKIIWQEISSKTKFTKGDDKIFIPNNAYFLTNFNEYLLAVLNSKVTNWYFPKISQYLGKRGFRYTKQYVEKIFIPTISEKEEKIYKSLVNNILEKKKNNPDADTSEYENQIDLMVYKLYKLNYDEVKVVDPEIDKVLSQFSLSKEDYGQMSVEEFYNNKFKGKNEQEK